MPRFYMHLRDGKDDVLDEDGVELPVGAIPNPAIRAARDCLAGDLLTSGRIVLKFWIDVHDREAPFVHSLSFADAVGVVPA